jgi:hypothetical protein
VIGKNSGATHRDLALAKFSARLVDAEILEFRQGSRTAPTGRCGVGGRARWCGGGRCAGALDTLRVIFDIKVSFERDGVVLNAYRD